MPQLTDTEIDNLSGEQLKNLIKRGIVRIMIASPINLMTMRVEDLPEYKIHNHLQGLGISISDAARKYDIPLVTMSQWVSKGIIPVIGFEKNKKLLDESYVAYCAEIRKKNPGSGKWLFNPEGTPHIRKF